MFQSFRAGVSKLLCGGRCVRPRRGMIPGALAVTGVCVGAAYLKGFGNGDAAMLLSLSPPLRDSVCQPWQTWLQFPWLVPPNYFPTPAREEVRTHDSTIPTSKDLNNASGTENGGGCCSNGCLGRDSIAKAAAKVNPAVVNIAVFDGLWSTGVPGSGIIIDSDGTILTCAHLVAKFQSGKIEAMGKLRVTLQDRRTFEAVVMHADRHSDIAVIKLNSNSPLPVAKLGLSANIVPGEWVLALCFPSALQNPLITSGIISCVDRTNSARCRSAYKGEYLQTNCAMNEDYSGGPLVNLNGEVIGVNIVNAMTVDEKSFAVPMEVVSTVFEHFRQHGPTVVRPWIGAMMIDLNDMKFAQMKERNLSFPSVNKGILISSVYKGSPAEEAGFRPGDVVIELEGVPVANVKEFTGIIRDQVGKSLKVLVKRANNETVLLELVPIEIKEGLNSQTTAK